MNVVVLKYPLLAELETFYWVHKSLTVRAFVCYYDVLRRPGGTLVFPVLWL